MSEIKNNKKSSDTKFWKGLRDYYDDPEILKIKANEFNDGVTDNFDPDELSGISRRKFIALLTASAAFTATACTDYRDKGEIVPYSKRPEEILPGIANYYASTCKGCELECGILIKTREGRPIKIDGNPEHPVSKGKICAKGQASILNLYDPDRISHPYIDNVKSSWKKLDTEILAELKKASENNKEIAIVSYRINSPSTYKALQQFKKKYPSANFYFYESFGEETKRKSWQLCYGTDQLPKIDLDKANIVISLDSDFLSREGNFIENTRLYSTRKDIMKSPDFNRLYSIEGGLSLTGMNADIRLRLKPELQDEFILSLLNELLIKRKVASIPSGNGLYSLINKYNLENFTRKQGWEESKINSLVSDLLENKGKSIILAGNTLSLNTHVLANLLNNVLGNEKLYDYSSANVLVTKNNDKESWKNFLGNMNDKKVGVVIHFDSNPVYELPSDYNYANSLKNVDAVISLSELPSETTGLSKYIVPINNTFESWGDSFTRSNVYNLQQPVIAPLFNTRQKEAVLLTWTDEKLKYSEDLYHKFLMQSFKDDIYTKQNPSSDFKSYWYSSVHDGFVELPTESTSYKFNISALNNIKVVSKKSGMSLHIQPNYFVGNRKFSNNGWLQEIPHPVSKVTWDNFAAVSFATANKLGLKNNDLISVEVNNTKMDLPVMVQPGLADNLLVVEAGYGRENSGTIESGVGFNVNKFLISDNLNFKYIFENVKVDKTGKTYKLVSTQEHNFLNEPDLRDFHKIRKIIFEGTIQEYKKDPKFLLPEEKVLHGITREHEYKGLKWGMAIDLNKCTSCGYCVAGCNVENNIPVVGKEQVAVGREMQWMRIDRYYSGSPDDPEVSNQPMLCQQCDNAPCENVCPVNATNHSPDGLNQMVYNRCVGTRYCSNNCPYKVRRFNFFNFRDHFADAYYENDLTALVNNPEVTVRSRGVMEKCTFCIQRIMEARQEAISEGRELKGDDVKTACQQACPADAIVFGDINDPESEVSKYRNHDIGYLVLKELYVKPNVTYMAKLRNKNSGEV